jgi:hypothetical protein
MNEHPRPCSMRKILRLDKNNSACSSENPLSLGSYIRRSAKLQDQRHSLTLLHVKMSTSDWRLWSQEVSNPKLCSSQSPKKSSRGIHDSRAFFIPSPSLIVRKPYLIITWPSICTCLVPFLPHITEKGGRRQYSTVEVSNTPLHILKFSEGGYLLIACLVRFLSSSLHQCTWTNWYIHNSRLMKPHIVLPRLFLSATNNSI